MDASRIFTCSIALIDYPPNKAFEIIRAAGYQKVDVLEKVPHLSRALTTAPLWRL